MTQGAIQFRDPITSEGINKTRPPFFEPGRYHGLDKATFGVTPNTITLSSASGYLSGNHDNETSSYKGCVVTQQGVVLTFPLTQDFSLLVPSYVGSPAYFGVFMEYEYSTDPGTPGTPLFRVVQAQPGSEPTILDGNTFYIGNADAMLWLNPSLRPSHCLVGLIEHNGTSDWPSNMTYRSRVTPYLAGRDPLTFVTSKVTIQGNKIWDRIHSKFVEWLDHTMGPVKTRGIKIGVGNRNATYPGYFDDQMGVYILDQDISGSSQYVISLYGDQINLEATHVFLPQNFFPSHNNHPVPRHYFHSAQRFINNYEPTLLPNWSNYDTPNTKATVVTTPDIVEVSGTLVKGSGAGDIAFYVKNEDRPRRDTLIRGTVIGGEFPSVIIKVLASTGEVQILSLTGTSIHFHFTYTRIQT